MWVLSSISPRATDAGALRMPGSAWTMERVCVAVGFFIGMTTGKDEGM
ncbi:MAG: hypothetical protein OIN85_07820 [Candidatus Methanoperedens sp.]|nr:hypothetical protein [Candidatus Methanoperedens sp.]